MSATTIETTIEQTDQAAPITDTEPNPGATGGSSEIVFSPEQQKLIDKRIADARRQGRSAAEEAAAEVKRQADAEAERTRQIAAGEFDKVRQSLEAERDALAAERDALKARNDTALTLIGATVDQDWKAAPEQVTKLFKGDDTDVLAKRQHLADHTDIIAALTEKQDTARAAAGFGRTPKPNGNGKNGVDTDARREQASIYRSTF